MNTSFIIRKSRNTSTIYVQYTHNSERVRFCTGVKTNRDYSYSLPIIQAIKQKIDGIAHELKLRNIDPTCDKVKQEYDKRQYPKIDEVKMAKDGINASQFVELFNETKNNKEMENLDIVIIEKQGGKRSCMENADFRVTPSEGKTHSFVLGILAGKKLFVNAGDEVLIGKVGTHYYIAKNPNDNHNGYELYRRYKSDTLNATRYANKNNLLFTNKALHDTMKHGNYYFGETVMKSGIIWHELIHENNIK
ncbi:MAG: hypothetical protein ACFFDN_25110 [Candidatus Hodarchaeota archaeon]